MAAHRAVVYDLFREFSQPTLKHRSLFGCLSSREQIPERLAALLALKHPDVPLLAPHLLMNWLRVFTSANTAHLGHRGGPDR